MKKLFSGKIEPACAYCEHSSLSSDGKTALCMKKGATPLDYSCRRFRYDPLKRKPHDAPEIAKADPEDFKL